MKRLFACALLVLAFGTTALADTQNVSVTTLDGGAFIVVQPIDGGSIVELMEVRDGKLVLVDSFRYTRKSELGGGFSVEFQHAQKIKEK